MKIFCVDSGSSSLKYALFEMDGGAENRLADGTLAGNASFDEAWAQLGGAASDAPDAIGHRIVFGGPDMRAPALVTKQMLDALERLRPVDPLHLRPEIGAIRAAQARFPQVPNVACFDTAFHRRMPELARRIALPDEAGALVQRYGYHGLSYEYILASLGERARGRIIIAHLGNGASMAAVRDGAPMDTTMGMTPLGGLVMSTRPGDVDPGVLLFLLEGGYTPATLTEMLFKRSGLLAVSAASGDMRELEERAASDERAAFAIDLFVYQACKHAGALATTLGGLDRFVFTGGIGEHSETIRSRVVERLRHLGDFEVLTIPTDENRMIARHTYSTLM